jgi:hypothetical protein
LVQLRHGEPADSGDPSSAIIELFNMSHPFRKDRIRMTSAAKLTKRCAGALLFLALGLPCTPVSAQASDAGSLRPQTPTHRSRKSNIDARVSILTKSLGLNDAQQSAVKNILEQRQQQTLLLRRDPSISGSARIERFRALQDNTVERIRAVLNDEQKKKYDPLASRQAQSTPERSVEDWLKAATPK